MTELGERLAALELFAGLAPAEMQALTETASTLELAAGDVLVRQGDDADATFVLLTGRLRATFEHESDSPRLLSTLLPGSTVGEIPFLAGGKRTATVRADEPSTVAVLTARAMARLLDVSPGVASRLAEIAAHRLRRSQLATHLSRLFPEVPAETLQELGNTVEWISLEAGETLFRQNEAGDAAYLIVTGGVRIAIADDANGGDRVIGEIPAGELVGEQAILLDTPRSATVYAGRDTDLARLPRAAFSEFLTRHPAVMLPMVRTLIARSREALRRPRRRATERVSLALIGLDPDLAAADFEQPLLDALAAFGPAIALSPDRVAAALCRPGIADSEPGDPAHIRLRQWIHEIEGTHRVVVYRGDDGHLAWTRRAIRQADRIVFVARAEGDPGARAIETAMQTPRAGLSQRTSLVLLHARDVERPTGTARWLAARDVEAVHHVRAGDAASFARLGRVLTGRAVGVVFGGGGARGFAHLGVMRALEELGVPIDIVGGASIGAAVSLPAAQGQDAAETKATLKHYFRSLLDYTLPVVSLLSGRRITHVIQEFAGSWDIEDCWLGYFCVSTNITTARVNVHRRGNLARAARASVAIPGVLPPVPAGEDLLVDGGVLNNLPLDVMREINPTGPVIAVHVVPARGPRAKSDFGLALSGWDLMARRWMPWRKRVLVPNLITTILRSVFVGSETGVARMVNDGLADLFLHIDAARVGLLAFETIDEVEQVGYEAALAPLRKWIAEGGLADRKPDTGAEDTASAAK